MDDNDQQQQQQQQQREREKEEGDEQQQRRKRARSEERESDDALLVVEEDKERDTHNLTHTATHTATHSLSHTAHTAHNMHTQSAVDPLCVEHDLMHVADAETEEREREREREEEPHTGTHIDTHTHTHGGDNDFAAELRLCRCLLNVHGLYLDLLHRTTANSNVNNNNNSNNNSNGNNNDGGSSSNRNRSSNSDGDMENNANDTSNVANTIATTTAAAAAARLTMSVTHALSCAESLSQLIPLLEETLQRAKQRHTLCERVISSSAAANYNNNNNSNSSVGNVIATHALATAEEKERASFAIQPVCGEALLALRAQPIKTATIATTTTTTAVPAQEEQRGKNFAQIVQDSLRSLHAKPFLLDTASHALENNGDRSSVTEQARDAEKEKTTLSPAPIIISERQRPSPSASSSLADNDNNNNTIVVKSSVPRGSTVAEEAFDELYLSHKGKYSFQFVTAADVFRDWYTRELFRCGDGLADRIQRAYFSRVHRLVSYMKCFLPVGVVIDVKPEPTEENGEEKLREWKETIAEMAEELGFILEEFVFVHTKADTPAKRKALAEAGHAEIEFKPFGTEPLSERRLKFPKITPFNTMIKVMPTIPGKLFPKSVVVDNNPSNYPQYLDFDAFHHR